VYQQRENLDPKEIVSLVEYSMKNNYENENEGFNHEDKIYQVSAISYFK
jgi:hypothetical protein